MLDKFKSRKFLLALSAQIVGLVVLFYPEHESEIVEAGTNITALVMMALTAAGWIKGESAIDTMRVRGEQDRLLYAERDQREATRTPPPTTPGTAGRVGPLIALAFVLAGTSGCALFAPADAVNPPTAADAWYEARRDLNTANQVYLAWAATADLNDRDEATTVLNWGRKLQRARGLLATAKTYLPDGGVAFDDVLDAIEAILIELVNQEQGNDGTSTDPGESANGPGAGVGPPGPPPADAARRANHPRAA